MKQWDSAAKKWIDVADPAQAQAQYLAGTHGFEPDAQIPVKDTYGNITVVPASGGGLDALLAKGGSIVSQQEADERALQKEYGGLKGEVIAGAEGAARGVSLGGSDVLAVEGARLVGGDELAEKTRTHIQKHQAANPKVALGTELGGAILPAIVSGGETAPETAAEVGTELAARAATRPSIIGTIARYTPAGIADAAGGAWSRAVERAAEKVLGERAASSALGRIAEASAKRAIGDAVPAMIYGGTSEFDENYLNSGNIGLSAEKTIAGLGHNAMWGMLLGGGLAGAGAITSEAAGPLLRASSPFLRKAAGEWTTRVLEPHAAGAREIARLPGGAVELGNMLAQDGAVRAGDKLEEVIPRLEAGEHQWGQKVDSLYEHLDNQGVQGPTIRQLTDNLRSNVLTDLESMPRANRGAIAEVKGIIEDLEHMASAPAKDAQPLSKVSRLFTDPAQPLANVPHGMALPEGLAAQFPELSKFKTVGEVRDALAKSDSKIVNDTRLTFKQLQELRTKMGGNINWKPQSFPGVVDTANEAKKDVYFALGNAIGEQTSKAADKIGGSFGDELQHANLRFRRYLTANRVAKNAQRLAEGRNIAAPSTKAFGMAAGIGALAHGVAAPAALATAGASALANHLFKTRGTSIVGTTLHKMAHMDFLARATQTVDRDLQRAAETLAGKSPYRRLSRFTGPEEGASAKAKWKHARDAYPQTQTVTADHLERALPGLQTHAPQVSKAILQKLNMAALYASLNAPKPLNKPTIADPMPEPRVTAQDAEGHYDRVRALEDPVEALASGAETGRLSAVEFQTIKQNYPQLLEDFKSKILDTLAKPHPPLTSDQTRFLSTIFEGAGDELSDPDVASVIQRAYATPAAQPQGQQSPQKTKPIEGLADASKTRLEQTRAQHSPGA